ncbi:AAA+ ATPase superfamily predicted ATPase [Allocatelliglobosispora scoriae]|uniref:AAA+ ATPase superfamily predicted ATPase n=1 Tax=Allocatelliglobosispora scoriae TaxID=643052 RepID=A0A841BPX9_9ACTN|nr:ATP-binding protein [Allocatelliglobosispora scoriae]MBB5871127.1 AAA+ ATPase superfamily predicted ATPase [Allocatelliglobosispora scoriae]
MTAIPKPAEIFDRTAEWAALARFAGAPTEQARFGVVSGRRRQGKTFLLSGLANAVGGFHFVATDDTEVQGLRRFGEALATYAGAGGQFHFSTWDEAIDRLYAVVRDRLIVIDEFPYLMKAAPVLPSLLQKALDPNGVARSSQAKLLICGSAMSVMGGILSGSAPLRGRASLELMVRPMDYLTAAEFWGCADDPELAVLLHSIVGGTPAYRHEFVHSDAPSDRTDFHAWVARTVLNPSVPLFREARYLLAEETEVRDAATYHAVLNAIATGHTSRGGIAGYLERPSTHIGHPLAVLEDTGLISKEPDAFRTSRSAYRINEPLITFYEAIMRRTWSFLERGMADQAWALARESFLSQVVGPHFEQICREYTLRSAVELFNAIPGQVAAGTVGDPGNKTQIQVDVAVIGAHERTVLGLGEVKWQRIMGLRHLGRLQRARDLLSVAGYDVSAVKLMCFSGAGFDAELTAAGARGDAVLIGLSDLYRR